MKVTSYLHRSGRPPTLPLTYIYTLHTHDLLYIVANRITSVASAVRSDRRNAIARHERDRAKLLATIYMRE